MTDMTTTERPLSPRLNRTKSLEYKLYFAVVFTASLPVAVIRELLPRQMPARGVIHEAKAMTNRVVPYIFMH